MKLKVFLFLLLSSSSILLYKSELSSQHRSVASHIGLSEIFKNLLELEENGEYDLEVQTQHYRSIVDSNSVNVDDQSLVQFKQLLEKSQNLERTYELLERAGVRELVSNEEAGNLHSLSWWLKKEPLKSTDLVSPQVGDVTAKDLGITIVNHVARDEKAYRSILNSESRHPNVFISRKRIEGELAQNGEGFYTLKGEEPVAGLWDRPKVLMVVNPNAIEGRDFIISSRLSLSNNDELVEVLILNKRAVEIVRSGESCADVLSRFLILTN